VGQNSLAVLQHHHVHGTRPLFHHRGLDHPGPDPRNRRVPRLAPGPWPLAPAHGLVSTHGPFSVTAMQCSKCAE
jgi:hypothetical protein